MIDSTRLFSGIPVGLRNPLVAAYLEIVTNYAEHRWEPAELNGGKLCEIVYSVISGALSGTFPAKPTKPGNMVDACRSLEKMPAVASRPGDRSLRILLPRALATLYEIRNNRNVGHVGGDVDPNHLDATTVLSLSSWVMSELVRIFHSISTEEAQESVDALVERRNPLIWQVGDVRRVLDPSMPAKDQALLLLHQRAGWQGEKNLADSVEYSSVAMFRTRVLVPLHADRRLEYNRVKGEARISPKGSRDVEERILKTRVR